MRPPGTLGERFSVLGELPAHGAESDLLRVRDAAGTDYVIKVFRAGFTADRAVWRHLPGIDSPHIVRIHETGHADGRDYEVMEYVSGGNLRALTPPDRPALSPELVAEIVAQLAAGLERLHELGIVHRDLKPENILVRAAMPVRLAITDFGLSKAIDQSVVFASSSRTLAYAAPESLSGQVSPARDWWSLGLIARELLTGRPPFGGMSETAVMDHLATRAIDVDDVDSPRLRLLCRGLLVRDPRRRWGAGEVREWLDGGSPPIPEDTAPIGPGAEVPAAGAAGIGAAADLSAPAPPGASVRALPFAGEHYTDRGALARAVTARWADAARYFFGATHATGETGEAWRALRDWLGRFDDDAGRIELIDRHLSGAAPPDVKLLHLVRWLDPSLPPHYLGHRVLPEDLPGLAAIVRQRGHADEATAGHIGRHLWSHGLLSTLAGFAGGDMLSDVADRWQGLVAAWNSLAARLRVELSPTGASTPANTGTGTPGNASAAARLPDAGAPGHDEPPVILLTLLALAARPTETGAQLAAAAARARQALPARIAWFDRLADQAGDDPVRLLAVVSVAPEATAEAAAAVRDRHAAEHQATQRRERRAELERQRLAGRSAAIIRALLWSAPLVVLWFGGTWLVAQLAVSAGVAQSSGVAIQAGVSSGFLLSGLAVAVQAGCEVFLATVQGGHYLRKGPWPAVAGTLRGIRGGLSGLARMTKQQRRARPGGGCLMALVVISVLFLMAIAVVFLLVAWLVWMAVLVVVPAGHVIAAGLRLHQWRREHSRGEPEAIEGARSDQ